MRKIDGERFDFTPDPIGISIEYPQTLVIDQGGQLWVGSRNGIVVFTPPDSLSGNFLQSSSSLLGGKHNEQAQDPVNSLGYILCGCMYLQPA
jgi:ligand-binding sensor domain-containing protein